MFLLGLEAVKISRLVSIFDPAVESLAGPKSRRGKLLIRSTTAGGNRGFSWARDGETDFSERTVQGGRGGNEETMRRKYARRVPAVFTRLICVFRLRNRSAKKYKKEGARRRRPMEIQQAGIRNRGGENRYACPGHSFRWISKKRRKTVRVLVCRVRARVETKVSVLLVSIDGHLVRCSLDRTKRSWFPVERSRRIRASGARGGPTRLNSARKVEKSEAERSLRSPRQIYGVHVYFPSITHGDHRDGRRSAERTRVNDRGDSCDRPIVSADSPWDHHFSPAPPSPRPRPLSPY